MPEDFVVIGPPVRVPGSDQFMFGVGVLLVLAGLVAVVAALVVRRRRARRDDRRRPVGLVAASVVAVLGLVVAVANRPLPFWVPEFPALPQLLPDDALFYRDVTDLPVSADSDRWIGALRTPEGDPLPIVPGMSGEVVEGVVYGIPFNPVDADTPRTTVSFSRDGDRSYQGPYPISDPAYIQSMPSLGIDNHYVAVDPEARLVWELGAARRWFGRWEAFTGARWSMDDSSYPDGYTTAAGLPLLPGVITYDEVAAGRVDHVALAGSPVARAGEHIWPARDTDATSTDPDAPPMGAWLRLRADVDLSSLPPQARVVAEGLQRYGMIISDSSGEGGNFQVRGTPDGRWDNDQLAALGDLTLDLFEVVDPTGIVVSGDSMATRPPPAR